MARAIREPARRGAAGVITPAAMKRSAIRWNPSTADAVTDVRLERDVAPRLRADERIPYSQTEACDG